MLEYLVIFGKGGAILWTFGQLLNIKGNPVDTLIQKCLLEERGGENSYVYKPPSGTQYTLKWTFHNGLDLVFVAAYQSRLTMPYVDDLLQAMKREFGKQYEPEALTFPQFDAVYQRLAQQAEKRQVTSKMRTQPAQSRSGANNGMSQQRDGGDTGYLQNGDEQTLEPGEHAALNMARKLLANKTEPQRTPIPGQLSNLGVYAGQLEEAGGGGVDASERAALKLAAKVFEHNTEPHRDVTANSDVGANGAGGVAGDVIGGSSGTGSGVIGVEQGSGGSTDEEVAFDTRALAKKFSRKTSAKKEKPVRVKAPSAKGKQPRNWGGPEAKTPEELDFSSARASSTAPAAATSDPASSAALQSRMDVVADTRYDDDDAELELQLNGKGSGQPAGLLAGFLSSLQTSVMGKEALTAEDLTAAVASMQKRLQERNVSSEVARSLCESVATALEGRKLSSFTGVSAIVRTGFEGAITRILSPPRSLDVLAEIRAQKAKGKPYSMVFVGVNGVGKSTNLAKIAYWLRQQNLRVMIAACDTFRSGAVEQLKTHCNRLGVPLYDRGYDKDPTNVAMEAMRQAERDGIDVVLVDTAGRMQDNEPLMHALSTLINKNNPNLVLFVGEALVGNDGVNQLVKFNQRLADLSPLGREARLIDGIVVTKFDAIDDKVGAVLSMAYSSGAPIMFVGCGQTYVDLMRLDVKSVVKSLLK